MKSKILSFKEFLQLEDSEGPGTTSSDIAAVDTVLDLSKCSDCRDDFICKKCQDSSELKNVK